MKLNKNYISLFEDLGKFSRTDAGRKAEKKANDMIQKTLINPK